MWADRKDGEMVVYNIQNKAQKEKWGWEMRWEMRGISSSKSTRWENKAVPRWLVGGSGGREFRWNRFGRWF